MGMSNFLVVLVSSVCIFSATRASKLWVQERIGQVSDLYFNKNSNKAYVATKQGVIAALDIENNGAILWRQVLDKYDTINRFEQTLDAKSTLSFSNGNVLRKWSNSDGSLLWESRQFVKDTTKLTKLTTQLQLQQPSSGGGDMQLLTSNKVVVVDDLDVLSLYDVDDGDLIWKQALKFNDDVDLNASRRHTLYAHEASNTVYVVTFFDTFVVIQTHSLSTGELQSSVTSEHECRSTLPVQFATAPFTQNDFTLVILYECEHDVSSAPTHAVSVSHDLTQTIALTVSYDVDRPVLRGGWKLDFTASSSAVTLSGARCQLYDVSFHAVNKLLSINIHERQSAHSACAVLDAAQSPQLRDRGRIEYVWAARASSTAAMSVVTSDGSFCFASSASRVDWCREESLALPHTVYLFDESEEESSLCNERMSEQECEAAYNAPFPSLGARLGHDLLSALTLSGVDGKEVLRRLNTFFPITSAWLDSTFEKIITILTDSGKLFALSSTAGDILWSVNLKTFCEDEDVDEYRIVSLLKVRQHPPHLLAILSSQSQSKIISISSPFHTTQPHIHVDSVAFATRNAFVTPWLSGEHSDKIVVLVSDENLLHVYPSAEKAALASHWNSIFYQTLSTTNQSLSGYRVFDDETVRTGLLVGDEVWRKSFADSANEIVDVVFSARDQLVVNAVYRTGERGAIYKYLNPHLIGMATVDRAQNVLHIYVVDGVTGRSYLHQYHPDVDLDMGGVSLLLFENKFVYSFFNGAAQSTEIHTVDLWSSSPQDVPTKARKPSEGYVVGENPLGDTNAFSSFAVREPFITTQAYNFVFAVEKLLCVSNTRYSVSNKFILAKLASGSIVQIDSKWLNTRRPMAHESTEGNKEEQLMPYKKMLPFSNLMTLSQGNTLRRVERAVSVGSPIESTSLFFAYGELDLFYTTINPSKNFDTIPADFDYAMLALILGGVVVAIFVSRQMAQSKKLSKEWK